MGCIALPVLYEQTVAEVAWGSHDPSGGQKDLIGAHIDATSHRDHIRYFLIPYTKSQDAAAQNNFSAKSTVFRRWVGQQHFFANLQIYTVRSAHPATCMVANEASELSDDI